MERHTQSTSSGSRRRRVAGGLKVAVFAVVLALLAAVPVLAAVIAPTSSSDYDFASTGAQSAAGEWKNESQTVTITATPSDENTVTAHFSADNGVTWETQSADDTHTAAFGFLVSAEGSHAIQYYASDSSHVATQTTQTPGFVNIDTVEPTTSASPALAANATSDWFDGPVSVTLDWADASSGVPDGGTSYRLNDGNLTIYGMPFAVNAEGSTKLTYRSVDRALNAEATQTAYVNIDTSTPTVSAIKAPSRSSGWYNKDVVVTLTGADAVSGIDKTQYRLKRATALPWLDAVNDQFTVLASDNAVETFEYRALDKAGNPSLMGSLKLRMDSVKPQTHGKAATGKVGKSMALKYKITDNLSPRAQFIWIKVRDSSGRTQSRIISGAKTINKWYSYSWKPKARGTYKYYVYAKDLAGNSQKTPVGWARITVR